MVNQSKILWTPCNTQGQWLLHIFMNNGELCSMSLTIHTEAHTYYESLHKKKNIMKVPSFVYLIKFKVSENRVVEKI